MNTLIFGTCASFWIITLLYGIFPGFNNLFEIFQFVLTLWLRILQVTRICICRKETRHKQIYIFLVNKLLTYRNSISIAYFFRFIFCSLMLKVRRAHLELEDSPAHRTSEHVQSEKLYIFRLNKKCKIVCSHHFRFNLKFN